MLGLAIRKVFRIGTERYNWPMSTHASQAFSIAHCTDSEDLSAIGSGEEFGGSFRPAVAVPYGSVKVVWYENQKDLHKISSHMLENSHSGALKSAALA